MMLDLSSLNSEQLKAVQTTSGPLLVVAGAGSGKTRVLTYRIAYMVASQGVQPYQILAITFTNKAAQEMRERLRHLLAGELSGMWVCTFHAMCVRILREYADHLGYEPGLTIYDADDQRRLIKEICAEYRLPKDCAPAYVRERISLAKNELLDSDDERLGDMLRQDYAREIRQMYHEYQRRLRAANAMDFDDLLAQTVKLFKTCPDVLEIYQQRFRFIHVDEYQDTNKAQYELARLLAAQHHNLMVVGDDDQSIYSWRGADIRNILEFEKDYPEAQLVQLEQNYRSSGHILNAANAVVAKNTGRRQKTLFTEAGLGEKILVYQATNEHDEANWIASEIKKEQQRGTNLSDIAVFYRTNAQSRILEEKFNRAGLSYRIVGGTRFFDRAEVKDALCYLRLVINPHDEMAFRRVINTPRRGLGATSMQRLTDYALEHGYSLFEAAEMAASYEGNYTKAARKGFAEFVSLISSLRRLEAGLSELVRHIIDSSQLVQTLEAEGSFESIGRAENIQELVNIAASFAEEELGLLEDDENQETPGFAGGSDTDHLMELEAFVEWLSLRTELDALAAQDRQDSVTLMTIHAAKGLEFPLVFVAGMEEGLFPTERAYGEQLEEERRLAYVAYTRAMRKLRLSYAEHRMIYGQTVYLPLSQFVRDIPDEHLQRARLGSEGISGIGWDKRGDRRGLAGVGSDLYGGQIHDNYTRSTGVQAEDENKCNQTFSRQSQTTTHFSVGDLVYHKVFGRARVLELDAKGEMLSVVLEQTGKTKRFMLGYAPIIKIQE